LFNKLRSIYKGWKLYNSILSASPDGLVILDRVGRIERVSPSAERMFGYVQSEVLQHDPVDFLVIGDRERARMNIVRAFQTGESLLADYTGIHRDGALFSVEVNVEVMPGRGAQPEGMILIIRDISERKLAMEKLRSSEMRWSFALEGAGDGVWDLNLQTREIFFSRQLKNMLGYRDSEIENRYEEWEQRVHPDDLARAINDIARYVNGEVTAYVNEHRLRCKDGSYKWILDRGKAVEWDQQGRPVRMVGTHSDITALKQYQLAIAEAREAADASERSTRRFFSVIAHEFNTPLGILTVSTDILDRYWDRLDEKGRREQHDRIRSAARQMSQLVNSVLNFNRDSMDNPASDVNTQIDVAGFCRSVCDEICLLWGSNRTLVTKIADNCGSICIDETQLRRILVNMLTNAFRYTGAGGKVVLSVGRRNGCLTVTVGDNGIGIPRHELDRVFDAFHRGSNVGSRSGLGLGLAIVRESLQKLGGRLRIRSAENRGTLFRVRIPVS